ncbi:MAG: GNAT family N-acetyltransferase [Alphaproteobacteria bacterium]|nr:GNAT family N-acetyltransferase [Alphaproteobacteria bacterium]
MIRCAKPEDMDQLHRLIKLWDEIKDTPQSALLEGIESQTVFCATTEQGEIVSFLQAAIGEKTWEINRLFTHPDQRGKGYGTALFNALASHLDKTGKSAIFITGKSNKGLQRIARKYGFVPDGAPKMGAPNMKMIRYPRKQTQSSPLPQEAALSL